MKRKPNSDASASPGGVAPGQPGAPLDKVSRSLNSARKATRKRPPRQSSAWRSAGRSWNRQRRSSPNRKPPKKPGPIRQVGRAAGGTVHGFVHGKILRWNRRTSAPRGPTAPNWWEKPPCGGAPASSRRKSGNTRQRLSSGRSPNISRPRQTIISKWPPRSTRK